MGKIYESLRYSGIITLDCNFLRGTYEDQSVYNNPVIVNGTPTWSAGPQGWGLEFIAAGQNLQINANATINGPQTIAWICQPSGFNSVNRLMFKRNAPIAGTDFDIYYSTTTANCFCNTGGSCQFPVKPICGIMIPSRGELYHEKGLSISLSGNAVPTGNLNDLYIGNYNSGDGAFRRPIYRTMLLNQALNQNQAQDLLKELQSERYPTRTYSYQKSPTLKLNSSHNPILASNFQEVVGRTVPDISTNNKSATLVGTCFKQGDTLYVQGGNAGYVNYGNITELNNATKATIYVVADPRNDGVSTFAPYVSRGDADTSRIGIYHGNTTTTVQFSASNGSNGYKQLAGLPNKINHLCLSYDGGRVGAGERVHTYVDGKKVNSTLMAEFPASLPNLTADLRLGQFTYATSLESRNKYKFVGIFAEALNEAQVREIYKQFSRVTNYINIDNIPSWTVLNTTSKQQVSQSMQLETGSATVRPFGTKTNGINLLTDGDMEAAGTASWGSGGSAVLSKVSPGYSGNQCLRISRVAAGFCWASQTILTSGKTYRVTGKVRGDGTSIMYLGDGNAISNVLGLSISTSWTNFDTVFSTTATGFLLGAQIVTAGGYIEYDDIRVEEVIEYDHKNITKLIVSNEALIYWKENSLYGSRRFSFYSGNACYIGIGSTNKIFSNSAQNAYFIVPAYYTIQLYKSVSGTFTLLASANITPANYYDIQWNIEYDGKITLWYKDKFTPNWSFGFTVTDTSVTSINYGILDLPACNSHVFGEILTNELAITPEEWGDGKIVPPNVLYDFDADDYSTTADLTAGQQLSTSGWIVGSGTWAITNVSGKKWIESRAANVSQYVYYPINQSSYGTWVYTIFKAVSAECQFAINDRPGMPWSAANSNGFWIHNNVNNFIGFNKVLNGTNTAHFITSNNYLANANQYRICFTRDFNGYTNVYVIGGTFTTWTLIVENSGANPFTINDINPTQYICLHGGQSGVRFSDIIHIEQIINPITSPELIPNI